MGCTDELPVHDTARCFSTLCFHRNLLHDDAFVDEVRVSIRHAASVVLRRAQQVVGISFPHYVDFSFEYS